MLLAWLLFALFVVLQEGVGIGQCTCTQIAAVWFGLCHFRHAQICHREWLGRMAHIRQVRAAIEANLGLEAAECSRCCLVACFTLTVGI